MTAKFTFGAVLQIVFKYLNVSPSVLAEFYIDRDRTLIYKWLHETATPSKKLVPGIIRFIKENSSEPTQIQIKTDVDEYISKSSLSKELKDTLINNENFENYLEDVLSIAIAESKSLKTTQDLSVAPQKQIKEPSRVVSIANIIFAILAGVTGGLLWNIVNNIFSWTYFMGGSGSEPYGLTAFIWGVVSMSPIVIFAVISLWKESSVICFKEFKKISLILFYSAAAGVGGLVFYNSGFRNFIESLNIGFGLQEIIIVFVYSLVLSFFPVLAVLLLMRLPKMKTLSFFGLEFFSAILCMLAVAITVVINRPESEIAQLRGFLVGFVLKLTMFISIRIIIKGYPDNINIPLLKQKQNYS